MIARGNTHRPECSAQYRKLIAAGQRIKTLIVAMTLGASSPGSMPDGVPSLAPGVCIIHRQGKEKGRGDGQDGPDRYGLAGLDKEEEREL